MSPSNKLKYVLIFIGCSALVLHIFGYLFPHQLNTHKVRNLETEVTKGVDDRLHIAGVYGPQFAAIDSLKPGRYSVRGTFQGTFSFALANNFRATLLLNRRENEVANNYASFSFSSVRKSKNFATKPSNADILYEFEVSCDFWKINPDDRLCLIMEDNVQPNSVVDPFYRDIGDGGQIKCNGPILLFAE